VKFAWIKDHRGEFALEPMCRALGVAKSGFYAWVGRKPSAASQRRAALAGKVQAAHRASRGIYGSPRVHQELLAAGEKVCRNTVAKIMSQERICSVIARKFIPRTTDSNHAFAVAENKLERRFEAEAPNQKWCADITYVQSGQGTLYLAAVIDCFSRRLVGWSMGPRMPVDLVADALEMAVQRRRPEAGLLHHSDRGSQYACGIYQDLLAGHGIVASMSRAGDCYDNALMESFWGTLKTECVYPHGPFATFEEARAAIFEYIEVFYNRVRRHSSLGYISPEAFEAALN